MSNPIFEYKCSCCGKYHEGTPSLAFGAPDHYEELDENEKKEFGKLSDDFCEVRNDRFVRVCLEIPIIGMDEGFLWGVWVSLSRNNYEEYKKKFKETYSAMYFGWLCIHLPLYKSTVNTPTTVHIEGNQKRPLISINESDTELYHDFISGINKDKAIKIFEYYQHKNDNKNAS